LVFVIDKRKTPLSPTTNANARRLLKQGKAVVHRVYPFVIRLKEFKKCDSTFAIKLDPGANITGGAIVDTIKAYYFFEIIHRGKTIKKSLMQRAGVRRSRRNRKTRYRKPRFLNRTKPVKWLAPSIKSRADNVVNIANKFAKYIPIDRVVIERVSFNTSRMTNGKMYGIQYQNGDLKDTKLRKFIFSKFNNTCVYCNGDSKDKRLEVEHVQSKSSDGTNSTKNLVLSCRICNEKKGKLGLDAFGKLMGKDYSHLKSKVTPKYAAIIQSARNYTINELAKSFRVETGEGWETALNRHDAGLPKEHYYDALCVGDNYKYKITTDAVLIIKATGRGDRQMQKMDRFGFPRTAPKDTKNVYGFQTGDMVKAIVPSGKKKGTYFGKVAIRSNGYFNIQDNNKTVQGISFRHCKVIQRGDGYLYGNKLPTPLSSPSKLKIIDGISRGGI